MFYQVSGKFSWFDSDITILPDGTFMVFGAFFIQSTVRFLVAKWTTPIIFVTIMSLMLAVSITFTCSRKNTFP